MDFGKKAESAVLKSRLRKLPVNNFYADWAQFNAAMRKVKDQKTPDMRKRLARKIAIQIRIELVNQAAKSKVIWSITSG